MRVIEVFGRFKETTKLLDLTFEGIAGGPDRFKGAIEFRERTGTRPFQADLEVRFQRGIDGGCVQGKRTVEEKRRVRITR